MTKEQWEAEFEATRISLINDKGVAPLTAWRVARKMTVRRYGPCPEEFKLPLPLRIGLWWLKREVGPLGPQEVRMLVQKLIVAAIYGIGAAAPVLQLALADAVITGNEWGGIASAFFVAFWGKFSSNTTLVKPSRAGETIAGPKKPRQF